MEAQKHVCGRCSDEWLTEAEYNSHVCPDTNARPTEAEHQGPEFVEIQRAALERGLEHAKEEGDEIQVAKNEEAIQQLATEVPQDSAPAEITVASPVVAPEVAPEAPVDPPASISVLQ